MTVKDLLHGKNGSRAVVKFRHDLLNRAGVKLGEVGVTGGRINMNSEAEIKRTASFTITEGKDIDWLSDRIQPVFCLKTPDGWMEWPMGVFMMSSPTRKNENNKIKRDVEAYDLSLILKEDKFIDRYYIPAGTNYIQAITDIINGAGIWQVTLTSHEGTTNVDKEFEIGTEKIFAINKLLAEINYTSLWVDENGFFNATPYTLPSKRKVDYEYRNDELSIILPGSVEELDLFSVPNQWVRYVENPDQGTLRSVYTNNLPTSPTSTVRKGRTIVDIDSVDDIFDQATLDAYTQRIAYLGSEVYGKFDFSTALMPHHGFNNCLYIRHTDFGISDKYIETSWSIDFNGIMKHSCRRVINV